MQENKKPVKRTIYAPDSRMGLNPGAVISIELAEDEDVHWIWTHRQNGQSFVSGYEIFKKTDQAVVKNQDTSSK